MLTILVACGAAVGYALAHVKIGPVLRLSNPMITEMSMTTIPRLLAVLLLVVAAGCTRYQVRTLPPPEDGPTSVRAARMTPRGAGTMVVLHDVRITADSVMGWAEGAPDRSGLLRGERTRVAVHRSEVLLFEPAEPDAWATAGAALSAVFVALGLYALNAVGNSG